VILGKAIGDYRILAWLNYGESHCVYKAFHSLHGRIYALALLQALPVRESPLQRIFLEQHDLATRLNHPSVGRVYPLDTLGDLVGVPLEVVPGRTLCEKIKDGQSSFDFALRVGIQVTEGLAAAHSIGLIHSRLTPKCLVVSSEGGLRILDFALAFLPDELARSKSHFDLPFASLVLPHSGPPPMAYLSPEQLEGFPADTSSDLYSLGLILYELLWGRFVVQSDSPGLIRQQMLEHDLPDLGEVRPEASTHWSRILGNLTRRKASERYPSAEALLADLKKLRDGWPTPHLSFTQRNKCISRRSFFLRFLGEEKK
jgi:serine/threonine protein kinase